MYSRIPYNILLVVALSLCILTSCDKDDATPTIKSDTSTSRVILIYMAAENNLSGMATTDINEILDGCTFMSDNDRVVVYLDNAVKGKAPSFYEITNKTEALALSELTPVHKLEKDYNSTSPYALEMAMRYVYDNYPADSYGVVLWSHASGWTPSNYDSESNIRIPVYTSFGVDTGNNNALSSWGKQMNIDDMAAVLGQFSNIDFLMFDACFMQCIEAAYELRNTAHYILASPAEIPGPGAPYDLLMQPMFADSLDMEKVMTAYYTYYNERLDYGVLLSVIDCSELENFAGVHSRMMHEYADNLAQIDLSSTQNYFIFDRWHRMTDVPDYYDIKGVMQQVITDSTHLQEWIEAFRRIVPHSCCTDTWYTDYAGTYMDVDRQQYGGVSMYVEQDKYKGHYFYDAYHNTAWARAIGH